MTLKELLNDWTEPDVASFYLACSLGLMEYNENLLLNGYHNVSGVFETRTQFGTMLVFRHELIHEGTEVLSGRKYVLRSDVMFL